MPIINQPEPAPKKISWLHTVYQRAAWIRVKYGRKILPPNDQRSNLALENAQVMYRRDDPVSNAFPINTGRDFTAESSAKRKWLGT